MNITDETKAPGETKVRETTALRKIGAEIISVARRQAELSDALHRLFPRREAMKAERGTAVAAGDDRTITKLRRDAAALDIEIEDHELAIAKLDQELAQLRQDEAAAADRVDAAELLGLMDTERVAANPVDAALNAFFGALEQLVTAQRAYREDLVTHVTPGQSFSRDLLRYVILWRLSGIFPNVVGWVAESERTSVVEYIERMQQTPREMITRELAG